LTAGGGFTPKALSKTNQTLIAVKTEGSVKMVDGSHPPAVREIFIEADKATEIHTKGIPTCTSGQLQATDTNAAPAACKSALIGALRCAGRYQAAEIRMRAGVALRFERRPAISEEPDFEQQS
jgi:hypothetical protein